MAESIVEQSNARTSLEYLDVPQLIKHILGLNCRYNGRFCLLYLWYRIDSPEATQHECELKEFEKAIDGEICLRALTYQELFRRIKQVPQTDSSYLSFLEQRYFSLS